MEPIKATLEKVMRSWEEKIQCSGEMDPGALFKNILTKKELGHIKFRYFKKGVLGMNADSSSWLYYFNLKKTAFLAKLQKQSDKIKEVRFYLGDV